MDVGQASAPHADLSNGAGGHLSQVVQALQAIYEASSTNDTRRQATDYLERAKHDANALTHGHTLALDRSQPPQLRHYGLTLLEYVAALRKKLSV